MIAGLMSVLCVTRCTIEQNCRSDYRQKSLGKHAFFIRTTSNNVCTIPSRSFLLNCALELRSNDNDAFSPVSVFDSVAANVHNVEETKRGNCGRLFFEKSQATAESQFLAAAHLSLLFPSRASTRCICPVCKTSRFNERTGGRRGGREGAARSAISPDIVSRTRRMIYEATRFSPRPTCERD